MITLSIEDKRKNLPQNVKKYLDKYSYPQYRLELKSDKVFEASVVIPVLYEYENLVKLLLSLLENEKRLFEKFVFIFVVNNTTSVSAKALADNKQTVQMLRRIIEGENPQNEFEEKVISSGLTIALVDASTKGNELDEKHGGVGLARKLGMDLSLVLLDYNSANKKFLVCLDADCTVAPNYLSEIYFEVNKRNIDAGYVRFEHPTEINPFSEPIILYELFLRYYVLGLSYAKSPYAFFTIGSTMIADYKAYISIEGMNKRKAAEDFYFMQKLSKKYEIAEIDSTVIFPSPRSSWRVPFGTGKSVGKYLETEDAPFFLHSPEIFTLLKKWLEVFESDKLMTGNQLISEAKSISPFLSIFLEQNNFLQSWDKISASAKSEEQLKRQKRFWFDGFRTLKLIHFLRDNQFPDIDGFEALDVMMELTGHEIPDMKTSNLALREKGLDYLMVLRRVRKISEQ
jgi:glycosyltransferase involved in cell wall biosynthesis